MAEAARSNAIDYAAYLELERAGDIRYEWYDGRVYAMAGGTIEHGALATAMIVELARLTAGTPCRVLNSDVKVRVRATGLATYPDVSVVCGGIERDPQDSNAAVNPVVLVEVLSESTEGYDRGEKFAHYRQIASLRDYVLVSQHARHIEVYSRDPENHWVLREARDGETLPVSALNGALDLGRIYADLTLAPAPARPSDSAR